MILGIRRCSRYILLDCDRRVHTSKSTGASGFKQGFLLIEVDIELSEVSNLATLGCTEGIVSQICDDGNQLLLFAVGSWFWFLPSTAQQY